MAGGHCPERRDSSARLPALVNLPACRTGIIQHWGGSQACWEGCWSLEIPMAFTLSATFSCPDLPTALVVYREKCTWRLRPGSGGEGQLTPKALLQRSASPEEIPAEAAPKYHKKVSGAHPTAQQRASNMDTECNSDVTVLNLLWTLLGNPRWTQPCQLLQPPNFSLASLGKHLPLSVRAFSCLAIQSHWR